MDPHEEKELEESLEYMRKQFRALTDDIKVPDSLRADLLKKQFELMEAGQEEEEARAQRKKRGKRPRQRGNVIPLRAFVGMAACFLVVGVSLLSFQLGKNAGSLASPSAAPEAAAADMAQAPEMARAMMDEEDSVAEDGGAIFPEDDMAYPAEAQGAPVPYEMDAGEAEPAPQLAGAPAGPAPDSPPLESPAVAQRSADPAETGTKQRALTDDSGKAWEDYLPGTLPEGLELSASSDNGSSFSASYLNGDYSRQIQVILRPLAPEDETNLVNPSAAETYDLRLYTQPYADSVPEELASIVNDPIFRQGDLSLSLVESRVFDPSGGAQARGNFSVLLSSGVVAEFNVTGVSASEVFAMISQMYQ